MKLHNLHQVHQFNACYYKLMTNSSNVWVVCWGLSSLVINPNTTSISVADQTPKGSWKTSYYNVKTRNENPRIVDIFWHHFPQSGWLFTWPYCTSLGPASCIFLLNWTPSFKCSPPAVLSAVTQCSKGNSFGPFLQIHY